MSNGEQKLGIMSLRETEIPNSVPEGRSSLAQAKLSRLYGTHCRMLDARLTAYGYLHGDCFKLCEVIQIVTCHGFNQVAKRHLSTLRMQDRL
jgi:hypothetical protein